MPFKTVLFLIAFFLGAGTSLYTPLAGVIGYIAHYHIWPEAQWWGIPLRPWGLRYSATFFGAALIGYCLSLFWDRRRFRTIVSSQEVLLVTVVALLWAYLPKMQGVDMALRPSLYQEDLSIKLTKIILFVLVMTRVVVSLSRFRAILWTLVVGSLYLGYDAYTAPQYQFSHGRLNGIGGPDFGESSYLGEHFIVMIPIIGVFFLRGDWKTRIICLIAGGFTVNGFILTRTRAAFMALAVGVLLVLILGVNGRRKKLFLYMVPAACVAFSLTDQGFMKRMTRIYEPDGQLEASAANRILIWTHSKELILDNPLGVGPGNFPRCIADYERTLYRRDAHNALIRCAAEWGLQGLALFLMLYANAFRLLWQSSRIARSTPYASEIRSYASVLAISLAMYFVCGLFMTNLYIESVWWMLAMPVCLFRVAESCVVAEAEAACKRPPARFCLPRLQRPTLRPAFGF